MFLSLVESAQITPVRGIPPHSQFGSLVVDEKVGLLVEGLTQNPP